MLTHITRGIAAALAASIAFAASGGARAQTYPSKPIKLLVPLAAGSTADIVSRFAALELGKALGQSVVVENKPGRGRHDRDDGARARDARWLYHRVRLAGHAGFQPGDLREPRVRFYERLRAGRVRRRRVERDDRAADERRVESRGHDRRGEGKPGQVTFSSGGSGTSHHLSGVLFGRMTGTDLVHVPYKGAPQGVLAVMTGEVAMGFFNTPTVIGQIKDGKVKALGVTSLKRSPLAAERAHAGRAGRQGLRSQHVVRFRAPRGTPLEIVARLNAELAGSSLPPRRRKSLGRRGSISRRRWRRPRSEADRRRPRDLGADRQGIRRDGELIRAHPRAARRRPR